MRVLARFAPLLVLLVIAGAAIYIMSRGQERAPAFEARLGRAAPAYQLAALEGGAVVTPEAFAGRPYVINFYASWCAPCRIEHPVLMRLREAGAPILGVAYKDNPAAAARLLSELGDPFAAHAQDPSGSFGIDLGIAGVPETFVIGADGRIAAAYRGPLTDEVLESTILPALRAR